MTDISTFIASMASDNLLTPNRFTVSITGSAGGPTAPAPVMMNCVNATIPSLNISTTQDKRYGVGSPMQFPDGRELIPVTLGFYEAVSHKERQFFSSWIGQMYNIQTRRFNFFDAISATVVISQYSKTDALLYQVQLLKAFPVHVSEMNRSAQQGTDHDILSISLAYNEINEIFVTQINNPLTTLAKALLVPVIGAPLASSTVNLLGTLI